MVGLHVRFAQARIYHTSYDPKWIQLYNERSYYLRDPVVFWGISHTGRVRWSEIRFPDPFGIFEQARRFGLNYGAVAGVGPMSSRSIVGISHTGREFTDDELATLERITHILHEHHEESLSLTDAQAEALRLLAAGDRHTAAAARLGITESAFKARLKSARIRLSARTTSEAIRKAREHRLI
ncbi:autoinducer binding domain-containing protein [Thioclava litoralis]|uniref:Autoinducer binding domain-containing protein n=2 Tax=Thioclava TaxID=285107 RepID=A0ABZ1DZS5_9RHOB|nr:autoinducer binding domain-containing protein [Thioclava sp. FTW29]